MCYKPAYRVRWLKNKAAILIIIWSYLATTVYHLLRSGFGNESEQENISVMGITMIAVTLLYPIGGWLADTYFGRYKTIHFSMLLMWIATVSMTVSELILANWKTLYNGHIEDSVRYVFSLILVVGLGGFQSNIVQLGIDQLTDASTTEITSFITWYALTPYMSGLTLQYATYCCSNSFYIKTFAVALFLSIALCLDCLFHQWLVKEHANRISLNIVYKVVKFLIKHRHSIIIENEISSRFDAAKRVYGGPFTNQQVEDVKSILRIIFLIAVCATVAGGATPIEYATQKLQHTMRGWIHKSRLIDCYEKLSIWYNDYLFIIALVTLYEFIIYPMHRYMYVYIKCSIKVTITSKFLIGTMLFGLHILALLSIEFVSYFGKTSSNMNSTKCIFIANDTYSEVTLVNYKWLLVPGFMRGLSIFLFFTSAIEFIWAQTPYFMTGLALGTMWAFLGLNTILQAAIASPFLFIKIPWRNIPLTCEIWYLLIQEILVAIFLVVGIIMVSKYKRRERSDSPLKSYVVSVNNY